ncbi:MAG: PEP/pyruvate-binding domain-containing protein [Polyangiales bacterium]
MQARSPYLLALLLCWSCVSDAEVADTDPAEQVACAAPYGDDAPLAPDGSGLRIVEVVSDNEGVAVDMLGETDDWLELVNDGPAPVLLSRYLVTDSGGKPRRLPALTLAPGAAIVLWADDTPEQGVTHLGFKLSASGETLALWADPCTPVDRVVVPALGVNESYARRADGTFASCRYATPGVPNGEACSPPPPPAPVDDVSFPPFTWPSDFPRTPAPLAITELALRPAAFIEVRNTSTREVVLRDYVLRLAPIAPGLPYPDARGGTQLAWPSPRLAPGERAVIAVPTTATAALAARGDFEGVATLFGPGAAVIDRVDFDAWPEGAVLARMPEPSGTFRLCAESTPGAANACTQVIRKPPDALRALHTQGDFAALAAGATAVGQAPVKFVVDMQAGDAVHFLADRWALHYTFVRERIEGLPALDRCDPEQAQRFYDAWVAFSDREYHGTESRRFLLGTLVEHASGLKTVEFATGDAIDAAHMRRAFLAVVARTDDPRAWTLRPTNAAHVATVRALVGTLPLVGPSAPFANLTYQPLTPAVGFGVLRFVPAAELSRAHLPAQTIVVTDDVPNDVPFVGGLITEAFQTPLAHVNVLSQARGTPNMALAGARRSPRLAPLLGKLVRLEVGPRDFSVREATVEEADAFFAARRPTGPKVVAPSDLRVREPMPLAGRGLADLPAIGAKAAQFAELYRVTPLTGACFDSPFAVPDAAFAIPIIHYVEHFEASGAAALLRARSAEPAFRADPDARAAALSAVRDAITRHPVEPTLLAQIEALVRARWSTRRVRFRSSSNVEDLPTFSGAGLHTSISAELGDDQRAVADAMRTVWASLWNLRAYDEREAANLDHDSARMGVLVHEAELGEAAQGVGISRDLLDVARDDVYYVNAQVGEATVTNPAPGVTTEQLLYTTRLGEPEVSYQTRSSLAEGRPVLDAVQLQSVACALESVHAHYRELLDPEYRDRLFAMQIEFKFERAGRLVVKQARPQPFGHVTPPVDCR